MERSVAVTVLIVIVAILAIIALVLFIQNNSNDAFALPLLGTGFLGRLKKRNA